MSPEQAKGKEIDRPTDVWAFGCVLYEMLTGHPPFEGETVGEILGGIFRAHPDWNRLPSETPEAIRRLLRRCLQKDRKDRLQHIGDVRIEIEEGLSDSASPVASQPARKSRERLLLAALAVVTMTLAVVSSLYFNLASIEAPEARLEINTPPGLGTGFRELSISPDGRQVVFEATIDGRSQLWLRALESETAKPLPGTDGGGFPFWSPDNRSIGFGAGGQLKRIDISSGSVQTLAEAPTFFGGAWSADGFIVFGAANTSPLLKIPAVGGKPEEATQLESLQGSHRLPHFLPDSRNFLFFVTGAPEVRGVYIGSLDSKDARRLIESDTEALFASPDYVLFKSGDTLFAQRLDLGTLEPQGERSAVTARVADVPGLDGGIRLSASLAGSLAYRQPSTSPRQFLWFDRTGKLVETVGEPDDVGIGGVRLSPDSRNVAVWRNVGGNQDIWVIDALRGSLRRFTTGLAIESFPNLVSGWEPYRVWFTSKGTL